MITSDNQLYIPLCISLHKNISGIKKRMRIMRKGTITIVYDLYDGTCEDEMMIYTNRLMEVINDSKDCDIGKFVDISYD